MAAVIALTVAGLDPSMRGPGLVFITLPMGTAAFGLGALLGANGVISVTGIAALDAILVTAGAPSLPPSLLDQLAPAGGRLVVPVGSPELQNVLRVTRSGTEFTTDEMTACRFVPLLGAEGWSP